MTLNKSRYIHLIIMLAIVFGISSLPPFGQITPFGMKVIGAFVAILYGWIFFDLFWTSIFGFMIIPVLGLNTVAGTFAGGLGNQQVINVILSMAFAVAIDFAGVTNIMANWLLQRRILQKKSVVFSMRYFSWRHADGCSRTGNGDSISALEHCYENCGVL